MALPRASTAFLPMKKLHLAGQAGATEHHGDRAEGLRTSRAGHRLRAIHSAHSSRSLLPL